MNNNNNNIIKNFKSKNNKNSNNIKFKINFMVYLLIFM